MDSAWDKDAFLDALRVTTDAELEAIAAAPQRSPAWFAARQHRLTASNFGAAAGHHVASGARAAALRAMLWPEFAKLEGRAAENAQYGTLHEPVALARYVDDRRRRMARPWQLRVQETGLVVSREHGWLAASPDFLVWEPAGSHERDPAPPPTNEHHVRAPYLCSSSSGDGAVPGSADAGDDDDDGTTFVRGCGEIKCPATLELYSSWDKNARYGMPHYHYDQVQGQMKLLGVTWCDYVVFTPVATQVTRIAFNAEYWDRELFPALKLFYEKDYLPRLADKHAGRLRPGQIDREAAPLPLPWLTLTAPPAPAQVKKRPRKTQPAAARKFAPPTLGGYLVVEEEEEDEEQQQEKSEKKSDKAPALAPAAAPALAPAQSTQQQETPAAEPAPAPREPECARVEALAPAPLRATCGDDDGDDDPAPPLPKPVNRPARPGLTFAAWLERAREEDDGEPAAAPAVPVPVPTGASWFQRVRADEAQELDKPSVLDAPRVPDAETLAAAALLDLGGV